MKCMHCGAEWTEGKNINAFGKCPFCGKSITVTVADEKELTMKNVLRHIVEVYGTDILSDQKKCLALFKDIAPDLKNDHQILSAALTSGVGEYFTSCPIAERESNIKKAIHSMDYLSSDAKSLVVTSLVDALGWDEALVTKCLQKKNEEEINNVSVFKETGYKNEPTVVTTNSNQFNSDSNYTNTSSSSGPNITGNHFTQFNKKVLIIVSVVLLFILSGYMLLGSGKDTSGNNAQPKPLKSAANSVTNTQNKDSNSVNDQQGRIANTNKNDVIRVARQRHGLISQNKQEVYYLNSPKFNAKNSSGNPVYFCGNPNYILIYEQLKEIPNKVAYLIKDTVEYEKNNSGTIIEIKVQTADIEDPKIKDPILIGIGEFRFLFNEETGMAGTNFGKVREFDYYEKDASLAYIPRSAALAYYIVTGKKWPKFKYGNNFYSKADL